MGGPGWESSWGPQDDDVSVAALHRAFDLGVTWVDTAPIYGLGHSEEVVGRALRGRRDSVFLATKCVGRWKEDRTSYTSGKADSVREECEQSLRRLGVDHLDLLQIHAPTGDAPVEETFGALLDLKQQGKTRYVGVSNFDVELTRRCLALGHVDSTQPPYNLLERGIEDGLLELCATEGIAVVPYGPMAQGTLSGTFDLTALDPGDWRASEGGRAKAEAARPVVEKLTPLAEQHGLTMGQLAILWAVGHPAVTSPIVGIRSPAQADALQPVLDAVDRAAELRAAVDAVLVGSDA